MRSILEALRRELDRLAEFGTGSIPVVSGPVAGGPVFGGPVFGGALGQGGSGGPEARSGGVAGSGLDQTATHQGPAGTASAAVAGAQDPSDHLAAPPRNGPAPIWSTAPGDPRTAPSR
jgi:hypothetical protein